MSEPTVNFHACISSGLTEEEVDAALDAAAEAAGLSCHDVERGPHGVTRRYGVGGAETLPFSYTLQPPCQLAMFALWRSRAGVFASLAVAEMLTRICEALNADLARTDSMGGIGWSTRQSSPARSNSSIGISTLDRAP